MNDLYIFNWQLRHFMIDRSRQRWNSHRKGRLMASVPADRERGLGKEHFAMRRLCLALFFTIILPFGPVIAAPQMLGVFATGPTPTPLRCADGVCSAEFSAFCLQQQRDAPLDGTAYTTVDPSQFQLSIRSADGQVRTVQAEGLTIRSARNYAALQISLPESTVRRLGGVEAAMHVAPHTSVEPVSVANDPMPITDTERRLAAGVHRKIGERYVEKAGKLSDSAKAAMTMINALPTDATALSADAQAAAAWSAIDPAGLNENSRGFLEQRVEACTTLARSAWFKGGVGTCLKSFHDSFVSTLNGDYWAAIGAGF
jgi:hypothetical protein